VNERAAKTIAQYQSQEREARGSRKLWSASRYWPGWVEGPRRADTLWLARRLLTSPPTLGNCDMR